MKLVRKFLNRMRPKSGGKFDKFLLTLMSHSNRVDIIQRAANPAVEKRYKELIGSGMNERDASMKALLEWKGK